MNFDKVIMKIIINNTECRELELKEKSSIKGEIINLCFQQIETKWWLHKIHLLILIL